MKARGTKVKRKPASSKSFGELIQKLWQPEPEELEPKIADAKQKKPDAKRKRIRER